MDSIAHIKLEAAKCVACGLCLPHCPTYQLLRDEAESPRGRLALMSAVASDRLPLSDRLETHLARCLACRACEKICPAYVDYGQALDAAREVIESRRSWTQRKHWPVSLLHWLVQRPARMRWLGKVLRLYQRSGLQWLLRHSRAIRLTGLTSLDAVIPRLTSKAQFQEHYPAGSNPRGYIALFLGCQAELSDRPALLASIRLLNRLGYTVRVPSGQGCCGALHVHAGDTAMFSEFMQRNVSAFSADEIIVGVASGCTATLKDYAKYADGNNDIDRFAARIRDINHFLADQDWPGSLAWRALPRRIAVHDPCTLTNVLRREKSPYALLARIPGVEIIRLPGNHSCCGAAGSYHLTQTSIARQLRAPKIAELMRLAPDILVTSNPGCATFLEAGLREAGLSIEVLHPVDLLARQLQD